MAKITDKGFIEDGSSDLEVGGRVTVKSKFDLSPRGPLTGSLPYTNQAVITVSDTFDTGDSIAARAYLEVKSLSPDYDTNFKVNMYTSHSPTEGWREVKVFGEDPFVEVAGMAQTNLIKQRALFLVDQYLQARYTLTGPLFSVTAFENFITTQGQALITDATSLVLTSNNDTSHLGEPDWGGIILKDLNTTGKLTGGRRLIFQLTDGYDTQKADCVVYGLNGAGSPVTESVHFTPGPNHPVVTLNVFTVVTRVFFPTPVLDPGYESFTFSIASSPDTTDPTPVVSAEVSLTGEVA